MNTTFNASLENIRMSPIVTISEAIRKKAPIFKEETGKDFIRFQRGEIDFPTPEYIRNAAKKALDDGFTKYPKSGGELIFKDAILGKLERFNKATGLTRENIVTTYGGQEALELSFKLFEGKKGAGFAPTWSVVLENFIPYSNIDFTEIPLRNDFSVDFDAIEEVAKTISFFYLNTPQNPTGKLFTREEVTRIVEICKKNDVFLISDEAYEKITFEGKKHFSPTSLEYDNIISTFTFSKSYSMTGWRLGYLVTRNDRIPRLLTMGNYTQTAGVTTFMQYAGKEALDNIEAEELAVSNMVSEFEKRRNLLYEGFKSIDGVELTKPDGAFYLFPNFSSFIPASIQGSERNTYIYNRLLEIGVAAVYGSCFGHHFADNIRFSFSTTPLPTIEDGIQRMREMFNQL